MTTLEATVNAPVLKAALAQVKRAIPKRTSLPICTMVHVEAGADQLTLKTTNLDMALVVTVPARVETQGAVVLDLPGLVNIAGMGKGTVALSVNGTAEASTAGVVVPLPMQKAEDFPAIPDGSTHEHVATLDVAEFTAAIAEVIVAVAKDDTRPMMTGVRLVFKDGKCNLAATDGFRLHFASVNALHILRHEAVVIVPASSLKALSQTVKSGPVRVLTHRNQVVFTAEGVRLVSRLIEGTFPNVERIIPTAFSSLWLLDAHSVHAMCKVAIKAESSHEIRFRYDGTRFLVEVPNGLGGLAATSVIDGMGEGPAVERIEFNARYLSEAIGTGDTFTLSLNDHNKACMVNGHLLMPMHSAGPRNRYGNAA